MRKRLVLLSGLAFITTQATVFASPRVSSKAKIMRQQGILSQPTYAVGVNRVSAALTKRYELSTIGAASVVPDHVQYAPPRRVFTVMTHRPFT